MKLNPELLRYSWLEFSTHRLIAMPVVIGMILYLCSQSTPPEEIIASAAQSIFVLLIGLWGGHKAAEAVIDEVNESTWDFQRLSSLSPASLTIGKLLGSPSYCWYGGCMALIAYIWVIFQSVSAYYLLCNVLLLVVSGLICHASALLSSLQAVQVRTQARGKMRVVGHQILGILVGSSFLMGLIPQREVWRIMASNNTVYPQVQWYGATYELTGFIACLAVIVLFWLLAGVYWQMRAQLKMRTGPWLWAAFVLFVMAYMAGFSNFDEFAPNMPATMPLIGFSVAMVSLYLMVFLEPWSGVYYRKLLDSWKNRNKAALMNLFPRWVVSLLFAVIAAILVVVMADKPVISMAVLACLAFAVRDIALLHYFTLQPGTRRATAAALFYLAVLYFLIPSLLGVLHLVDLLPLFMPVPHTLQVGTAVLSLLSASTQAAFLLLLTFRRWKQYWQ